MESKIDRVDIEEIVKIAAKQYSISYDELNFIGGFQNFIYEFKRNDEFYILRLTNSSHRSENDITAELDWILYLSEQEVSLSRPVLSCNKKLLEVIVFKDIQMFAVLFRKALGKKLKYPEYLNSPDIFEKLGELTGRIHRASKKYKIKNESIKRHQWFDNYYLKNLEKFIPEEQAAIRNAYEVLRNQLISLRQDGESFGLIHGDINLGNFCVENNLVTLFDFDECQYSWFIEDIAIQLFYTVYVVLDDSVEERKSMAELFMNHFMKGYERENFLEEYWLKQLPVFLKLRELIVHVGIYRSWNFNNLNQWQKDYLEQSGARIKNGMPIIEITDNWG